VGVPTLAHFVYIPCVILVGIVIGWILGGRAARDYFAAEQRKAEDREKRKAERAARDARVRAEPATGQGNKPPEA
jgi:hypothetical protein